jgi:hypothetical protein
MKIKISKKPSIREKDSIEMDFLTSKPLWKGNIKYKIVDIFLKNNFIPETVTGTAFAVFTGNKKGVPFSKETLDKVFEYCVPRKSSIGDIFVSDSVFFFSKKPKKYYFHLGFMGGRNTDWHNSVSLSLETFKDAEIVKNAKQLFDEICLFIEPDFARIQFYTGEEHHIDSLASTIIAGKDDVVLSSNRHIMKYLPDIYAIVVFGKPYINFFGKDKILSSPCYKVEELPNGFIKIQLGDYIFGERGSKESLKDVRQAVKSHLNINAFFDPKLPQDHKYNVPEFDLSEIRAPIELPTIENNPAIQGETT